jgi:predicted aspartyl protease
VRRFLPCLARCQLTANEEGAVRHIVLIGLGAALTAGAVALAAKPPQPLPPPAQGQALPPATIDNSLEVEGEAVKAKRVRTRLLLNVAVNGRGPYRFVVDSGADSSAVGAKLARDLALPVVDHVIVNSTTARQLIDRVRVDSLTVGPTVISGLNLPALNEQDIGGDGIVGIDALVKQRLKMDFEHKTVSVEDAKKAMALEPGTIVITAQRRRGQLILTEARAGGAPIDAVIDTGSEITIGNQALLDRLSQRRETEILNVPVVGVTGVTALMRLVVVRELRVGPIVMHDVPIAFADIPPFKLFALDQKPALLLGTDVLEQFRSISLDFRARRVRFQLGSCEPMAGEISVMTPTASHIRTSTGSMQCGSR